MNTVAVFIDFENIKLSVDQYFKDERVDLKRILDEVQRVTEGRILLKRAYADWGAFKDYRSDLLDNATEPVQTFALTYKGKNGSDIRIAIDVMDVALRQQTDITHVALVSGDSDFTPLVVKLREFGLYVIGVGVRNNTSNYLAKSCDSFYYYDDLRAAGSEVAPERAVPSMPMDPVALIALALASLGNRPVTASLLKTQMRKMDPMFDETRHGHGSFLEFLRAHQEILDYYKPAVGDVTVAPKGQMTMPSIESEDGGGDYDERADTAPYAGTSANGTVPPPEGPPEVRAYRHPSYTPYGGPVAPPPLPSAPFSPVTAPLTTSDKYRLWLRDNNFRYVPFAERREIIGVVYDIFTDPENGALSLKEGKDRLHLWFETNRPAVSWESVNSTVYHLFYTWSFDFDKSDADDGKQLWDRRTTLRAEIRNMSDLVAHSERGIVRKLWERDRSAVDADALNDWLFDGKPEMRPVVFEMMRSVSAAPASGFVQNGMNGNDVGIGGLGGPLPTRTIL